MKKLITIVVAVCLTMAVAAQHGLSRSRIYIVAPSYSFGLGYSPFYYSPFGYYPYGYPYGYNNGYRSSSKLQMQIDDIKNDYSDKIKSAKHDTSLTKDEQKNIVHQLKTERDKAVNDAKTNYYKPKKPAPQPEDKS